MKCLLKFGVEIKNIWGGGELRWVIGELTYRDEKSKVKVKREKLTCRWGGSVLRLNTPSPYHMLWEE